MQNSIFDDFVFEEKVSKEAIDKYDGKIPEEVLKIWKTYGFGSILNGYLKIINPEKIQVILEVVYSRHQDSIPLFTTSMGDIIVWEKERYLIILNFRKMAVSVISVGFDFFLEDLNDESFLDEELNYQPYPKAVEKYGHLAYDECFGFVPLLGLGGEEKIEKLDKVKLNEHVYLITHFMGHIE